MREGHPSERRVGVEFYASDADGTGGRLRTDADDFRVRELETVSPEPVDADPGAYPHLLLRVSLRGWDTNDFAKRIADAMGISRERVSWAGTKDKRAVTTQLFSVRGVDPDDLPAVRDADVVVVGRFGRSLAFGDLAGNAFEVRVRDAECPENAAAVTADLRAFAGTAGEAAASDAAGGARVGVPNYFGHQRFGSVRPVTHEVGLRVARGEWRGAVLAYVGNPAEAEPDDTRAARAFVDEQAASDDPDWGAALEGMPRRLGYERSMLHRLADDGAETPEDFRHALEAVPSNLQRLFVNAAQSYAFNLMLSERLRRGLPFDRPVAGDVVCFADRDAPADLALPDADRLQRVTEDRVDVVARHCARGRAFVTAPLVGTETELGDGEPGEIERAVLSDLDLSPSDFDLPEEFHSKGTRRAVLLRTGVDVCRGGEEDDGDGKGELTFSFSLPKGSYATVLLREYLKTGSLDL